MSDLTGKLHDLLEQQLQQSDFDLVDLVPIPNHSDRMVRLRTLKEVIEDFDGPGSEGTVGYFVQVRPRPQPQKQQTQQQQQAAAATAAALAEAPYLPDGKLNIPFLMRNAELLLGSGEYALSKNIYKTVLQTGERTAHSLFGIAQCLEGENKLDEARRHYEESIAYHPALQTYRQLGLLLGRMQKEQEAAEVLSRALNLKDISPQVRFELHQACGNFWSRARKFDQAEMHFKKALELNPASDDLRTNLGALTLQFGRTSEAKRHFQDALAANPRNHKALVGMGSCYLADGEKRIAHDHFARALDLELNNPTAVFHLVKCAYEIKSYATAARILEEYVQIAPINANLMYSLAGLQFHLGRMNEARATCRRITEIQPAHPGATELLKLIERQSAI